MIPPWKEDAMYFLPAQQIHLIFLGSISPVIIFYFLSGAEWFK